MIVSRYSFSGPVLQHQFEESSTKRLVHHQKQRVSFSQKSILYRLFPSFTSLESLASLHQKNPEDPLIDDICAYIEFSVGHAKKYGCLHIDQSNEFIRPINTPLSTPLSRQYLGVIDVYKPEDIERFVHMLESEKDTFEKLYTPIFDKQHVD